MSNSFQAYRYFHPISTQNLRLGSCIILHTTCVCYAIFRIYVLFYSEAVCFLPKMLDSISGLINIEFAFNQEGNYLPFKLVMSIPQVPTHVYVPSFSNPVLSISIHQDWPPCNRTRPDGFNGCSEAQQMSPPSSPVSASTARFAPRSSA
jgi:hypothetical protein